MKLCLKILAIAVVAATTYSMIGCGAPPAYSYSNVSVNITSKCTDCAAGAGGISIIYAPAQQGSVGGVMLMPIAGEGGTIVMTANVTNAPPVSNVTWTIYPTYDMTDPTPATGTTLPVGESAPAGPIGNLIVESGDTAVYTAGTGVPIYNGAELAQAKTIPYNITYQVPSTALSGVLGYTTVVEQETGIPQGDALIEASVPDNPDNPSSLAIGYQLIQYYNNNGTPSLYLTPQTPTNPGGLTTPVLTVPAGTTYQFYGGAVGTAPCFSTSSTCSNGQPVYSVDNGVVWEVGPNPSAAVTGGSATYGTISTTGLYTAPKTPPPGNSAVIVLAAHAALAIQDYAYITIK